MRCSRTTTANSKSNSAGTVQQWLFPSLPSEGSHERWGTHHTNVHLISSLSKASPNTCPPYRGTTCSCFDRTNRCTTMTTDGLSRSSSTRTKPHGSGGLRHPCCMRDALCINNQSHMNNEAVHRVLCAWFFSSHSQLKSCASIRLAEGLSCYVMWEKYTNFVTLLVQRRRHVPQAVLFCVRCNICLAWIFIG